MMIEKRRPRTARIMKGRVGRLLLLWLLLPACLSVLYLYLYPAFHLCRFPEPRTPKQCANKARSPTPAPFRLLVLADPQLEGDSSLPNPNAPKFPRLRAAVSEVGNLLYGLDVSGAVIRSELIDFVRHDVRRWLRGYQKRIDLFGNDFYLAHIYRTLFWWTAPTHVTVLGDLIGSQWVSDEEFQRRSDRYWNRVFRGAEKIDAALMQSYDTIFDLNRTDANHGAGPSDWSRQLINIVGNHDVGYSGDMNLARVARFEERFGPVNGMFSLAMPCLAGQACQEQERNILRIVVLNSMNLDGPVEDSDLAAETRVFMDTVAAKLGERDAARQGVVLLTHIPLYKPEGICTDGPFFDYFAEEYGSGVKEQNHLSNDSSRDVLQQFFRFGGPADLQAGVILTGHDHAGCDTFHFPNGSAEDPESWDVARYTKAAHGAGRGVREITVRSMMGEYGGNAGLLSVWTDCDGAWRFGYASCPLGVQHVWWAVHIVALIAAGVVLAAVAWEAHSYRCQAKGKENGK